MSSSTLTPDVDIRRAEQRFTSNFGWLDSKHSFSFGHHHDRANTHHGLLLVNNDDIVDPGTGFETHPHQDMEIVTWVLQGSLVHQDSTGHNGVIYPGLAQRMSAGRGILHSEKNDSWRLGGEPHRDPVHFVQMWVVPDEDNITPGYEQLEIDDELLTGGLVPVASGMDKHDGASAIRIRNQYAALHAARLQPGQTRRAARGAVPAPVRAPRRRHPGGCRRPGHRGRRPVHRHRRPEGHRHRAGRDPGVGDARHPRRLTPARLAIDIGGQRHDTAGPHRSKAVHV